MNITLQVAEHFVNRGEIITGVEEYGRGIIHSTYLVKLDGGTKQFILQRVNTHVFKNPAAIMENMRLVSEHIRQKTALESATVDKCWQMLQVLPTTTNKDFFIDKDGGFWRALSFIKEAVPLERVSSEKDAREAGRALGTFHLLTSDLNPKFLRDTLPGFHNFEQYLRHYYEVAGRAGHTAAPDSFCQSFIGSRKGWAPVLEKGRRAKLLNVRVIHGDPKINNIMVDRISGKAVSIIDLDTVMPGLVQYDIGDCLRSCCNIRGEETSDFSAVQFDDKMCRAVLTGYTQAARGFLTNSDFDFLFDAVRLIPFELGLRFYTDYLEGNKYFKVRYRNQNLDRALVQFKLVESIEEQENGIRRIIAECRAVS